MFFVLFVIKREINSLEILINRVFYVFALLEHIPLEQGLRQGLPIGSRGLSRLLEHIPLEQGLRLAELNRESYYRRTLRAYSIRTRIKTHSIKTPDSRSGHS